MAVIKMSGLGVTDASGKLGGNVFARNKGGATLRKLTKSNNPKTNAQLSQRGLFSATSGAWRGLTQEQRDAWIAAAASGEWSSPNRLGEIINPTGSALYNELNLTINLAKGTAITDPPLKASFTAIEINALTAEVADLNIAYNGTLSADETLLIEATGSISSGVSRPGIFKKIAVSNAASPITFTAEYEGVWGAPTIGAKVFVRLSILNELTGQRQLLGQVSSIVA